MQAFGYPLCRPHFLVDCLYVNLIRPETQVSGTEVDLFKVIPLIPSLEELFVSEVLPVLVSKDC